MKYLNSIPHIVILYVISIIASTVLFSYFEDRSLSDGLWWSVVTALTIGYGDISPITSAGRVTGVIFGHFWVFFILPMIVASLVIKFVKDDHKFTHAEQEWQEAALEKICKRLNVDIPAAPDHE